MRLRRRSLAFAHSEATRLVSGKFFGTLAIARSSVALGSPQHALAVWPLVPQTRCTLAVCFPWITTGAFIGNECGSGGGSGNLFLCVGTLPIFEKLLGENLGYRVDSWANSRFLFDRGVS